MRLLGLRGKLILALAVITLLTVLCAVTAIYSAGRSASLLQHVHDTTLPSLRSTERLARQSESAFAHIANLPAVQSMRELDLLRHGWRVIDRTLNATLRDLGKNPSPPPDLAMLSRQIDHVRAIRTRLDTTVSAFLRIKSQQKASHDDLLQAGEKFQSILEPLIAIAEQERAAAQTPAENRADLIVDPQPPDAPTIDPTTIEPAAGPLPGETLALLFQLGQATSDIVNVLLAVEQEDRQQHLQLATLRARSYAERAEAQLPGLDREVSGYLRGLVEQILSHGIGPTGLPELRRKVLASERQMAALRVNASGLFQRVKSTIDGIIDNTSDAFDLEQQAFEQAQLQMSLLVLAAAITSILASIGIGGFFVQRRVVEPILDLSEAITAFEQDGTIADDLQGGRDEIGRLGRAFVEMANHRQQAEIDLTEQNKLLATANTELARSNQELDDFAYIAAHDLREPVRAMQNHARFLEEDYSEQLGDDGKKRVCRMIVLGERMDQLMRDLLFFARLGRGEQATEPVDPKGVIDEIEESLAEALKARHARIIVENDLPMITGNRAQVATIFRNLIGNGIKYNDAEDKVIEIGKTSSDDEATTFHVRDNGIGIDDGFQKDVFRIFKRLNSEKAYGAGTGAGLSFVKKIVENQGGRIWFESRLGEGTTFFFTLKTAAQVHSAEGQCSDEGPKSQTASL